MHLVRALSVQSGSRRADGAVGVNVCQNGADYDGGAATFAYGPSVSIPGGPVRGGTPLTLSIGALDQSLNRTEAVAPTCVFGDPEGNESQ